MAKDVHKNYIYHIIYRLSICILPLVVTPYVARVLGVENNGLYAFSSTLALYFIMLGKLGFESYGSREIAYVKDNRQERSKAFWNIYSLQVMASLLTITLYIGTINIFFKPHTIIYLMQLIYVISVVFDVSWFFYGIGEFRLTTIRSLISRFLLIIGVFLFVSNQDHLWLFTGIMSASFLLEQLILFPFIFKYVDLVRIGWRDIIQHIRPSLRLFIPVLALSINNWMDKIMLGIVDGNTSVAYYNYAESIINLPKGLVLALGTVMLPAVSYRVKDGLTESFKDTFQGSMTIILLMAFALCFGIAGVAPVFVPWFLGPDYYGTVILTIELALVMIPMSIIDVIQTQYLIPYKKETVYIRSVVLGAFTNLLLNLLLIPIWGASGAVIGTIGASTAMCLYQTFHTRDILPIRKLSQILLPFLILGIMEFILVYLIGTLKLKAILLIPLQIIAGGILYMGGSLAYFLIFRPKWGNILTWWKGMSI